MNSKVSLSLMVVGLLAACGDRSHGTAVDQKQYETVQEGAASGVTATIQGPGETLPPITGTNADTTTAFALNPNAAGMPTGQGAGQTQQSASLSSGQPMAGSPMTAPMSTPPTAGAIPRPATAQPRQASAEPRPSTQPAEPRRDDGNQPVTPAATPTPAPPATETAEPTPAPPQPAPNAQPKEDPAPPADDAEQSDEPAPPPTQTDTP
jgi:hypothetical protein